MESFPLISIVLPVYGVEEYLEKCIESLINQTYKNIEIIFVDDGSKDKCPQILDAWAQKDSRIVVYHKSNAGQSSARNLGMDKANGEFITFVDSDDWVEPHYIEMLYRTILMFDAEISVGSFKRVIKEKTYFAKFFIESKDIYYSCTANHAVKYFLENAIAVWGKLYRKDILQGIRFPLGKLAEEYVFQLEALIKSKKVAFCNQYLYAYRIRGDSDSHNIKPKYMIDNIQAIDNSLEICKIHFQMEIGFCESWLATLLYEIFAAQEFGKEEKEKYKYVLQHACMAIGGIDNLSSKMQNPLETIFYSYRQFQSNLSIEEKRKLQSDFRKCFWEEGMFRKFIDLKYLLSFVSLKLAYKISKFVH